MNNRETYRGSTIEVFTSMLASGHASFVIYIDDKLLTAEIDGPDQDDTVIAAFKRAKREIDKRLGGRE